MGKAHSNGWRQVNHFFPDLPAKVELTAICGRDAAAVERARGIFGWGQGGNRLAQNRGRAGH